MPTPAETSESSDVLSDKQTWLKRGSTTSTVPGATSVRPSTDTRTPTNPNPDDDGRGGGSSFTNAKGRMSTSSRGGGGGGGQRTTNRHGGGATNPTNTKQQATKNTYNNSLSNKDGTVFGIRPDPSTAIKTSIFRERNKPTFQQPNDNGDKEYDDYDDKDYSHDKNFSPTMQREDSESGWSNFSGHLPMTRPVGRNTTSVPPKQDRDSFPFVDPTSSESPPAPSDPISIQEQNASSDMEDKDQSNDMGLHPVTEATLVDPTERENEAERIRQETLHEVQSKTVRAQVVDETAQRKRVVRLAIGCACVFVIVVVVTAVSLVRMNDGGDFMPSRAEAINTAVEQEFGSEGINDESSSQYMAINWMAVNDTLLEFPLETEAERRAFRQRYAMCVLAFATNIDTWVRETDWLEPVDECTWSGLTCNDNRELVAISTRKCISFFVSKCYSIVISFPILFLAFGLLANRNLTGTLPTELGTLSLLRYMFIYDNPGLEGSIPPELGNATSLELFHAQDCSLTGTIPDEFSKLSSLQKLVLAGNKFSGTLPLTMVRMLSAVEIDLSRNNFTGPVLPTLWRQQKLQVLLLNDNSFTGPLSPNFGDLALLERLEIQNNFLTGDLPTQLGNLRALEVLRTYGNSIDATEVPDEVCSLRRDLPLPGLQVLEMDCTEPCRCCTSCQNTSVYIN